MPENPSSIHDDPGRLPPPGPATESNTQRYDEHEHLFREQFVQVSKRHGPGKFLNGTVRYEIAAVEECAMVKQGTDWVRGTVQRLLITLRPMEGDTWALVMQERKPVLLERGTETYSYYDLMTNADLADIRTMVNHAVGFALKEMREGRTLKQEDDASALAAMPQRDAGRNSDIQ